MSDEVKNVSGEASVPSDETSVAPEESAGLSDEAGLVAEGAEDVQEGAEEEPEEVLPKETSTSIVGTIKAEVAAASDVNFTVGVSCPPPCDLTGLKVRIVSEDGSPEDVDVWRPPGWEYIQQEEAAARALAEGATEEETVSEEAPSEEAVSDEAPAEEAVSEEVPAEEVDSEEVPAEEVDSEEVPAEEAVAEEVPGVEFELIDFDEGLSKTALLTLKAPREPGKHSWKAVFPAQMLNGIEYTESSVPFSFVVKTHTTGMAVWDVQSPVSLESAFSVKVGVHCVPADCVLTGKEVEVFDDHGVKVGTAALSDTPWAATKSLYWAEVPLQAPDNIGYREWIVKFPEPEGLEFAHEGSQFKFGFAVSKPPEHAVSVRVVDSETKGPIDEADVILFARDGFPYRTRSASDGSAHLNVATGNYSVFVDKFEYKPFETMMEIAEDVEIEAPLIFTAVEGFSYAR